MTSVTDIDCRSLVPSDRSLLFAWRNDPRVYRYFNSPTSVEWSAHEKWFDELLKSSTALFYLAEYKKKPCGIIRYDLRSETSVEVGLYLAPEFQGRGLSSALLNAGEVKLRKVWPQIEQITAQVHPDNQASLRMFEKDGYSGEARALIKNLKKVGKINS